MSVINPDEWDDYRTHVAQDSSGSWSNDLLAVLCLLDLARYGTVQWFPDTDPVDVPWARFARNTPEWVRCVDPEGGRQLTVGKVYRVLSVETGWTMVKNDDGWRCQYPSRCFVPATADEATVTIDVPVAWARWARDRSILKGWPGQDHEQQVRDACREALTKAGLL